uniref:Uncharacterized protein n=1 Tax=Anopheles minimus TaxID=112268 RepID=A0A182VPW4_9DIPT
MSRVYTSKTANNLVEICNIINCKPIRYPRLPCNHSAVELHTMASYTFTQRLLVALTICTLIADLTTLTAARPQDSDAASVAAAIRYLQELETKHAQHARPRCMQ